VESKNAGIEQLIVYAVVIERWCN